VDVDRYWDATVSIGGIEEKEEEYTMLTTVIMPPAATLL